MSNLTITVDDEVLKRARMRALMHDTSVNAVLREFLEAYAGVRSVQEKAVRDLLSLSRSANAGQGDAHWTREELHERGS